MAALELHDGKHEIDGMGWVSLTCDSNGRRAWIYGGHGGFPHL